MATQKVSLAESKILRAYFEKTPRSRALHARARALLPNGVTHITRYLEPYPIYVNRAAGSHKWDEDGNEYVDYFGGHGALILGHNHPAVVEAVEKQVALGSHYGASHELEIAWAEMIHEMVPSAERVRFTNSGTEATHLALRLARVFTGKSKIVRFSGHFHGWHDHVSFPQGGAEGIPQGIVDEVLFADPNDLRKVEELLSTRRDNAAVILEPTGATFGKVPTSGDTLLALRDLTSRFGVLLIFDEVISGFRCSPGGAQKLFGVTPDLTTLAKIVAGGYPGAVVAGRADVLAPLEFRSGGETITAPRVPHQGTFNAAPVSAAAGVTTLKIIRDTDAIERANRSAAAIRDGLNAILRRRGLGWCAYGRFSEFHIFTGNATAEDVLAGRVPWKALKPAAPSALQHKIRLGFLLHGVDIVGWPGGLVSAAHTPEDVARTLAAFDATLDLLAAEGEL
jgi:glutamate-1-semialdehyde 2,1-aminomutase